MKKTNLTRTLCLLLCFALTLALAPLAVADEAPNVLPTELTDLRETYAKHFDNHDDSFTAIAYAYPVHKESNGQLVEIDNTLQSQGNTLQNVNGLFDVSFSIANGTNTISQNGYSLSWQLDGSAQPAAQIVNMVDPDPYAAKKAISRVTYTDVFPGIDLTYTVNPLKVKEDIVLKSPSNISQFSTLITAQGLTPTLFEDGSVSFTSGNYVEIFAFPAPFMTDAADNESRDIAVTLTQEGEQWRYTLTPNSQWLAQSQYPVVLDPTAVPVTNTSANVMDSYTYENCAVSFANSHKNDTTMKVGNYSGQPKSRMFIKFKNLPDMGTNKRIDSTVLKLTATTGTSTYGALLCGNVTTAWDYNNYTQSGFPARPTSSTAASGTINTANRTASFEFYQIAKYTWYGTTNGTVSNPSATPANNKGLEVQYSNESLADYNQYYTAEAASGQPTLVITYTNLAQAVNFTSSVPSTLAKGSSTTVVATVSPTATNVVWTSSNYNRARIGSSSNTGSYTQPSGSTVAIYGVGEGAVTITAKSETNTTVTATFSFTVRPVTYGNFSYGTFVTPEDSSAQTAKTLSNSNYNTISTTAAHLSYYAAAQATAVGGFLLSMPAACSFLSHFLDNTGTNYLIDFSYMIAGNSAASAHAVADVNAAISAAEYFFNYYSIVNFSSNVESGRSSSTGSGDSTNNWYNAIGLYRTWSNCTVTKSGSSYTMIVKYNLRDFYDWNPTNTNPAPLVSPAQMSLLHKAGIAREFYVSGQAKIQVTWTTGQTVGTGANLIYVLNEA